MDNSTHTYRTQPSLRTLENNALVLLTWSSIVQGQPHRVLSEWAASDDGWSLYQRLIRDIQDHQTTEQLALTLAALLCYKRLLPYSSNDTIQSVKGCYLADFDALMSGEPLSNERTVYERMIFPFLQVIDTSRGDYQVIHQFLATVLDIDAPTSEPPDRFSDQYWQCRTKKGGLAHKDALGTLKHAESKPSLQSYNWWTFVPAMLSAR